MEYLPLEEDQDYCDDVHIFDSKTSTWHQPLVIGTVAARYLHSAIVYKDKLFVYGGFAKTSDCTFVLDEMCVLDLSTMTWTTFHNMPPRYNHSATLVGNKMYIYAGKDEQGTTVSDLFMIHLQKNYYTPHLLRGNNLCENSEMTLAKSQHFCEAVCGRLLVFGRYTNPKQLESGAEPDLVYSLWMLDLDTLEWEKQECSRYFEVGGWNYFSMIRETLNDRTNSPGAQVSCNNLLFLGNTDPYRLQGYDHFRDALIISSESLGLYDIGDPRPPTTEFIQLLNSPELSDFSVITGDGKEIHVHQVILLSRWPHFRNLHKSGMFESIAKKITIPEPFTVVMAFLKYIYSDSLDTSESWQVVCELLLLSDLYLLHRLKKICCERLYKHHMSVESCGYIFEKAIMTEEIGLKALALDFMFRNYGSFLKTNIFITLPALVQEEFLRAVPDGAVLEVGRPKFSSNKDSSSSNSDSNNNSSSPSRSSNSSNRSDNHNGSHSNNSSSSATLLNNNRSQSYNNLIEFSNHNIQSAQAELIPIENPSDMTVEA
ncbi:hypothetical protein G6F22_007071 [Rhizopus arrhizus]|nr:hypothetical protein G6F22_007071 [Rhizopus arrhizus]KAG1224176.1 hypothetical protein G6F35_004187 [Rhizopus arrhizus]